MLSKTVRRPSPALIVAMIALVAAFAGSAIALPGKNSVKGNDIAKNAVKSSDVKNDKLKGVDIDESTLGKVPSATKADSAAAVDTQRHVGPVRLAVGQTQVLDTRGPFSITAECADGGGNQIDAILTLTTSQDDTAAVADWATSEPDFDVGDDLTISDSSSPNASNPDFDGFYSGWMAVTSDGNTQYTGERAYTGARVGASDCYFGLFPVF
jgi:hypothetical protein